MSEPRTNEPMLDAVARRTGAFISRRTSLLAAGVMLAASLTAPAAAHAGNAGKKSRRRARRGCQRQGDQCRASVTQICTGIAQCFDISCCDRFQNCQAAEAVRCLFGIEI